MADDLDKENKETDFDLGNDEFSEFNNTQSLGSAIQNNAALKIGVIAAAFILVIGGFMLFSGSSDTSKTDRSDVGTGGAALNEAPTTEAVTPSYQDAIEEFNEEGEEVATQTGESFIPVPTGPATNTGIVVPEDERIDEDPLERWRMLQEERAMQQREQLTLSEETNSGELSAEEQRRQEAVQTLAQAMVTSMQELASKPEGISMEIRNVIDDDEEFYEEELEDDHRKEIERIDRRKELIEKRNELAEIDPSLQVPGVSAPVIITPGTIEYAQMLIQANSDIPGPVLAQIVTGPLRGARLIGEFSVEQDSYLVITFNTAVLNGQTFEIEAIAIDPETNLTGVVTDVDNRYFKRLVLPVAANFIEGLADALAETQETVNITGDVVVVEQNDLDTDEAVAEAIADAGEELAQFVEQEADKTKVLVRVAAGTPIGVLFTQSVVDCSDGACDEIASNAN